MVFLHLNPKRVCLAKERGKYGIKEWLGKRNVFGVENRCNMEVIHTGLEMCGVLITTNFLLETGLPVYFILQRFSSSSKFHEIWWLFLKFIWNKYSGIFFNKIWAVFFSFFSNQVLYFCEWLYLLLELWIYPWWY